MNDAIEASETGQTILPPQAPTGRTNPLQALFLKELQRVNHTEWIPKGQTWWIEPAYPQQHQMMCGSKVYTLKSLQPDAWELTLTEKLLQQPKALLAFHHKTSGCRTWYTVKLHHEVPTLTTRGVINPQSPFTPSNSAWVIQDLPNPTHYITDTTKPWVAKTRLLPQQAVRSYQAKPRPDVLKQHAVLLMIHLPHQALMKHHAMAQQDGNLGEWIYLTHHLPSPKFPKLLKGRITAPNVVEVHL